MKTKYLLALLLPVFWTFPKNIYGQGDFGRVTPQSAERTIVGTPDTALLRKYAERNLPIQEQMNTKIENYLWYAKFNVFPNPVNSTLNIEMFLTDNYLLSETILKH